MPDKHAMLGPSSAHRWLVCPPSARLNEDIEDKGSDFAREGTVAHKVAELVLRSEILVEDVAAELAEVEADPMYNATMREHCEDYGLFITERLNEAKATCSDPLLFVEQEIQFDQYVPEGFGTADCVIIADGTMDVIDFKYGAGVPVSAEDNPQMKLYGLGALLAFDFLYDISVVRMTIYQPRIDNVSTFEVFRESLYQWAKDVLKPAAAQAWAGEGAFCPGAEQCKWCKVGATCKARAAYHLATVREDFDDATLMNPAEIAEIVLKKKAIENWLKQVDEFALDQAVNHKATYPGLKLVEGISRRKYTDEGAIAAALAEAGVNTDTIFKPAELLGFGEMEKLVGKKRFGELAGQWIDKPAGKPTLVSESDKRPALDTAAKAEADFTVIENEKEI
jgi:hypothetical protein